MLFVADMMDFYWPSRVDSCWVPCDKIICHTEAPATSSGRMYKMKDTEYEKIIQYVQTLYLVQFLKKHFKLNKEIELSFLFFDNEFK